MWFWCQQNSHSLIYFSQTGMIMLASTLHIFVFTFRFPMPPAPGSKTSLPTDRNQSNYFQAFFSPKCAFLLFYIYSYGLSIFLLIVLISHFCHLLVLSYYLCFIPVLISLYMWHVTMTIKALFYSILVYKHNFSQHKSLIWNNKNNKYKNRSMFYKKWI